MVVMVTREACGPGRVARRAWPPALPSGRRAGRPAVRGVIDAAPRSAAVHLSANSSWPGVKIVDNGIGVEKSREQPDSEPLGRLDIGRRRRAHGEEQELELPDNDAIPNGMDPKPIRFAEVIGGEINGPLGGGRLRHRDYVPGSC